MVSKLNSPPQCTKAPFSLRRAKSQESYTEKIVYCARFSGWHFLMRTSFQKCLIPSFLTYRCRTQRHPLRLRWNIRQRNHRRQKARETSRRQRPQRHLQINEKRHTNTRQIRSGCCTHAPGEEVWWTGWRNGRSGAVYWGGICEV